MRGPETSALGACAGGGGLVAITPEEGTSASAKRSSSDRGQPSSRTDGAREDSVDARRHVDVFPATASGGMVGHADDRVVRKDVGLTSGHATTFLVQCGARLFVADVSPSAARGFSTSSPTSFIPLRVSGSRRDRPRSQPARRDDAGRDDAAPHRCSDLRENRVTRKKKPPRATGERREMISLRYFGDLRGSFCTVCHTSGPLTRFGASARVVDLIADHLSTGPEEPVFRRFTGRRAGLLPCRRRRRFPFRGKICVCQDTIEPYPFGNGHPRLWGWVNSPHALMGASRRLAAADETERAGGQPRRDLRRAPATGWLRDMLGCPATSMGLARQRRIRGDDDGARRRAAREREAPPVSTSASKACPRRRRPRLLHVDGGRIAAASSARAVGSAAASVR